MSSRKKTSKPPKRRRTEIGQPTEDDSPSAHVQSHSSLPSATAWSTRRVHIQSLTQLCIQVFARTFTRLHEEGNWESLKAWLVILPVAQIARLFAALRSTCPTRLSNTEITVCSSLPLMQHIFHRTISIFCVALPSSSQTI